MSYLFNNKVELTSLDAFGRVKTADAMTIADYSHVYGENSEMLFKTLGTGTYSYRTNEASVRLSAGVQNAFVITKYSGLDPEVFSGIDNTIYPRQRQFLFGVNMKF